MITLDNNETFEVTQIEANDTVYGRKYNVYGTHFTGHTNSTIGSRGYVVIVKEEWERFFMKSFHNRSTIFYPEYCGNVLTNPRMRVECEIVTAQFLSEELGFKFFKCSNLIKQDEDDKQNENERTKKKMDTEKIMDELLAPTGPEEEEVSTQEAEIYTEDECIDDPWADDDDDYDDDYEDTYTMDEDGNIDDLNRTIDKLHEIITYFAGERYSEHNYEVATERLGEATEAVDELYSIANEYE